MASLPVKPTILTIKWNGISNSGLTISLTYSSTIDKNNEEGLVANQVKYITNNRVEWLNYT